MANVFAAQELVDGYNLAKRKFEELRESKKQIASDHKELHHKYQERVGWAPCICRFVPRQKLLC